MIKKLLGKLLKPIILKEMRLMMKGLLQPILDLVKALVQPAQGSKFLITLAAIGAITYLHTKGIATDASDITVAAVAAAYYIADIFYKNQKQKAETWVCDDHNNNGDGTEE